MDRVVDAGAEWVTRRLAGGESLERRGAAMVGDVGNSRIAKRRFRARSAGESEERRTAFDQGEKSGGRTNMI